METDVTFRGQKTIRNKKGTRINIARWTLTSAEPPEQPDAQQNCKIVKTAAANDERLLRCSRGKNARLMTGQQFTHTTKSPNFSRKLINNNDNNNRYLYSALLIFTYTNSP